jgi:SAP domain
MTSNQPYISAAGQARETTERLAGAWREGMTKLADQATTMIPTDAPVDLNQAVDRYFQFVQRTVDVNRDLAISWAELVDTLTGATREQAESFSRIVRDQADTLAGMAAHQFERTEQVAQGRVEQVEQERRVKRARQAEGDRVKLDRAKAREAYEGLTKAELSDQLAALGLPKSGNVDDLIDRLVEANDN